MNDHYLKEIAESLKIIANIMQTKQEEEFLANLKIVEEKQIPQMPMSKIAKLAKENIDAK